MDSGSRDEGVFIRSMAGRGHPGGLALRTVEVSDVLDAYGFDLVLIETIGTGQDEVEIVKAADVVVLVLNPGAGDGIQALKAGLMEVADLIVINKADREGAEELRREIESALDFRPMGEVRPPVLLASALRGTGLAELIAAIDAFRASGEASGLLRRRREEHLRERVRRLVEDRLRQELWNGSGSEQTLETWVQRILDRREGDPWTAADEIYGRVAGGRMHA
jgi:LAO/AO transport system kinase